jgi:hypothetical protein
MWMLVLAVVLATAVIVAAVNSASDNIIGELHRMPRPNSDDSISKYDLEDFRSALADIKELLSISCPQCGDEPWYTTTVAEQRVWLEEHITAHRSGKLEQRTLDDIIAARHTEEERKHKDFEASHKHLFSTEENEGEEKDANQDQPPTSPLEISQTTRNLEWATRPPISEQLSPHADAAAPSHSLPHAVMLQFPRQRRGRPLVS